MLKRLATRRQGPLAALIGLAIAFVLAPTASAGCTHPAARVAAMHDTFVDPVVMGVADAPPASPWPDSSSPCAHGACAPAPPLPAPATTFAGLDRPEVLGSMIQAHQFAPDPLRRGAEHPAELHPQTHPSTIMRPPRASNA